jgi:Acetyltransferases
MIRKATKEDVACIAEMASMMWDSYLEELIEEFGAVLDNEECAIYLYQTGNMPIGFAQCGLRHDYVEGTESSSVGYLEGIFIREDYRRKGYAKNLLVECEKWAKQKGCSEFASDCELDNDASLAFHINMGFTEANREIADKLRLVFAEWIDNGHNDFEDINTIILCINLTDGVLLSHGTAYDIEF